MRSVFIHSFIVLALILGYSQISYADCSGSMNGMGGQDIDCPSPLQPTPLNTGSAPAFTTGDPDNINIPNPGGLDVIGAIAINAAAGNDTVTVSGLVRSDGDHAIVVDGDNDTVTINDGAEVESIGDNTIQMGSGTDTFIMNGGSVTSDTGDGVRTGTDPDTVIINGGTISAPNGDFLNTRPQPDTVTINGGAFTGDLVTEGGADNVIINGGTYNDTVIDTGGGADTIQINTDVVLDEIDCGPAADTLIFSMDVPEGEVANLTAEFLAQGNNGQMTINGILYDWTSCNNRVPNFNGTVTTITLEPFSEINEIISNHTVTATVLTDGVPEPGFLVSFNIVAGPNQGLSDDNVTNSNGQATFTYEGELLGTDQIVASIEVQGLGVLSSNTVSKTWILPSRNVPTLSEWGLISMAALLGIIAFIVMRRRQVNA